MSNLIFHRRDLSEALTQKLLHPGILETSIRDGLFLTGIRRIGKTTFLQQDLVPALTEAGALVIYVDLWSQRGSASPTKTVLSAVRQTLSNLTASGTKLKEVKVNMKLLELTFHTESVGKEDGISLADAFCEVITKIQKNIVLIIDEVQETLKNEAGYNLLTALKAARDAVNLRPGDHDHYLLIVGTGSHRSFVSAMTTRASQPFYGADRMDFPPLGKAFVTWLIGQLRTDASAKIPSEKALLEGFDILGHRPKTFRQMLNSIQTYTGQELDEAFIAVCTAQAQMDADEYLEPIKASDPITKALFTEIAKGGTSGVGNLHSASFLKRLTETTGSAKPIRASSVQAKLTRMLKKDWIYPIGHGCYAATDPQGALVWRNNLDEYLLLP